MYTVQGHREEAKEGVCVGFQLPDNIAVAN